MRRSAIALRLAGALAIGAANTVQAAPVPTQSAAVKSAAPDSITDVRWRRGWGWGPAIGAGIAAGIIGGAAWAAAGPYPYYPYAYGYPIYPAYYPYPYAGPYPYWRPRRVARYVYYGRPWYRPAVYVGGGPYWGW